ncbi:TonB-dependent receptor domain-containing protein [Alteromonas gracilis]|uniref:TonB-dependent receptor domain-containing protein n=1 Tax=Alteromonas gracilis TaxID=1479524 RepID=UPI003735CE7F
MFTTSKLALAVKLAGVVGATSFALATPVMAQQNQEPDSAAEESVEKIQVTGSRIRSPNAVSTSPIQTVGEIQIEQLQQPELERVLRLLPGVIPGDNSSVNNGSGGAATVNLRGLGENRNLVLMNGKRLVPYNNEGEVDTSIIPTALIKNVDIVTGGASAVYGSDAISGAINVILKDDFEGAELEISHSRTDQADAQTKNISLTVGGNFDGDRGNAVVSASWLDRDPLLLGQRDLGNYGISTASGANFQQFLDGTPPVAPPANCGDQTPNVVAPGGGSGTTMPTRMQIPGVPGANGQFRDDGTWVNGDTCSAFNFNPFNYYQTPAKRWSATAMGHYDISDEHTAYSTITFTNTSVRQQVAPSGIFGSVFDIPLANPFMSDAARSAFITAANENIDGLNEQNAIAAESGLPLTWTDVNGNGVVDAEDRMRTTFFRRTLELGPRSTEFNTDQFQILVGMEGFITDEWAYDVSFQHGETNRVNTFAGYTNVDNIANALNAVDTERCLTGGDGCVPLNIFGGFGTITPEMAGYASATALSRTEYQQRVFMANIDGPIENFVSPFADTPLSMSFGYEYREDLSRFTPDECLKLAPSSCLGGAGGNSLPVGGSFKVNELYGEGRFALVEDAAFAEILELEFGYRHSNFDTVGDVGAWKLGLAWRPSSELLVRVMNQQATRAPNVGELFAPTTTSLDNADLDPCSVANATALAGDADLRALCVATGMTESQVGQVEDIIEGQINTFSGSNPAALPDEETAKTFTAGFVFTPEVSWATSALLSVDYYDIDVDGYISENSPQEILDGCYVLGNLDQCAQITRVGGGLLLDGSGISTFTTNLSWLRTRGIEATYNFNFDIGEYGNLSLNGNVNHYLEAERLSAPTSDIIDCNGFYGPNCNPQHKTRSVNRATWSYDDYSVSLMWRYLSDIEREESLVATTFEPFRQIGSYSYFDLFANYQVTDYARLAFGVDNLFDKAPPVVGGQAAATDYNAGNTLPAHYDVLGRTYRFTLTMAF